MTTQLAGIISPAAIAGSITDWAPTGGAAANIIRVALSADATLVSMTGGIDGRTLTLCNIDSAYSLTLRNNDAIGTAGARFLCPNGVDLIVAPLAEITLTYDGTSARWRTSGMSVSIGAVSVLDFALSSAITGTTPLLAGSIYLSASGTLRKESRAMVGTTSGGTGTVRLRRHSTGVLVSGASWDGVGAGLSNVQLGAAATIPAADWYDIELVGDAAGTTAVLEGLYLVF